MQSGTARNRRPCRILIGRKQKSACPDLSYISALWDTGYGNPKQFTDYIICQAPAKSRELGENSHFFHRENNFP